MTETTSPLPKVGEFWCNKRSGTRVQVRRVARTSKGEAGVFLDDMEESIDLGWRFLFEFLNAYERIGTVDSAHAAALAEIGMETCEECDGTAQGEWIDAPEYKGYAKCPACERGLVALGESQ